MLAETTPGRVALVQPDADWHVSEADGFPRSFATRDTSLYNAPIR
ncbi:hypothetical protein ACIGHB_32620 [Streptomyces sp. NPDC085460]